MDAVKPLKRNLPDSTRLDGVQRRLPTLTGRIPSNNPRDHNTRGGDIALLKHDLSPRQIDVIPVAERETFGRIERFARSAQIAAIPRCNTITQKDAHECTIGNAGDRSNHHRDDDASRWCDCARALE